MNTTPLSYLLSRISLNKVWFGRKAQGPSLKIPDLDAEEDSKVESTNKEEDLNSEDESFLLLGLSKLN